MRYFYSATEEARKTQDRAAEKALREGLATGQNGEHALDLAWHLLEREDARHEVLDRKATQAAGASAVLVAIMGSLFKSGTAELAPIIGWLLPATAAAMVSVGAALFALLARRRTDVDRSFLLKPDRMGVDAATFQSRAAAHIARVAGEKDTENEERAGLVQLAQVAFAICVLLLAVATSIELVLLLGGP